MKTLVSTLTLSAVLLAQQQQPPPPPVFVQARLASAGVPGLAAPTVVGGGEVLLEAVVDVSGAVTHLVALRSTPPFTQMVLDALRAWRFTPARLRFPDGKQQTVESSILVAAVYRPPTLLGGPTLGEGPKEVSAASVNVPYPSAVVTPVYPLKGWNPQGSVLLFEVDLDEAGRSRAVRAIRSDPGFDTVAREALAQWRFRAASFKGRPAPSTAYVVFGFSAPVILGPSVGPQPPVPTPGFPFPPVGPVQPVQPAPPVTPVPPATSKP